MPSFALFNYQFKKIVQPVEVDLFGCSSVLMTAEEAFPQRQELFDELMRKDYSGEQKIVFRNLSEKKEYIHRHLMPPMDGMVVMKVANRKTRTLHTEKFDTKTEFDYTNCLVVIDNRPGIQRMAIESKPTVFPKMWMLMNILSATFNRILKPYSMGIELMNLQDSRDFWAYANDRQNYPKGFYRVVFHFPYLNLERLQKVVEKILTDVRSSYDCRMDLNLVAQDGRELLLKEDDSRQKVLVDCAMQEIGGATIDLYSNENRRKPIIVGKSSFRFVAITDGTFVRLMDDVASNDLFGSQALDEIKRQTKKGIE